MSLLRGAPDKHAELRERCVEYMIANRETATFQLILATLLFSLIWMAIISSGLATSSSCGAVDLQVLRELATGRKPPVNVQIPKIGNSS